MWTSHWTTDTAILLVGLGIRTWTSSVCVHFAVLIFLSVDNEKSTGQVGDIKIFAAPGVIPILDLYSEIQTLNLLIVDLPEGRSLIQHKQDVLARFSQVLKYLAEVYKIPLTSLHIFADKEKQLIAFNRNGSLFVNLGHFEAWRTSWVSVVSRYSILIVIVRRP